MMRDIAKDPKLARRHAAARFATGTKDTADFADPDPSVLSLVYAHGVSWNDQSNQASLFVCWSGFAADIMRGRGQGIHARRLVRG